MENVQTNSIKAWILAARPKTLAAAATPVLIGCSLAVADGAFQWIPAILCFLFAFSMQIDANFINDYYDYLKGSDREDRLGPERACAQGWITLSAMKKGMIFITLLSCFWGILLLRYCGWEMIPVGLLCVLFAFLYTAGPYPLAYHGWGDVLVIVFFGFVPVGCTYYTMAHDWTWNVTIGCAACGLVSDLLLMLNNYRDREQDKISGKRTLVVRLGEKAGRYAYLLLGIIATGLCSYYAFHELLLASLLPLLFLILHFTTWREMVRIFQGKELNIVLGKTARNIVVFGILLSLGLIL
ncbi:MAG: 1,4-dihydroxy-2-naphthoate polyprenyltransferase [Bacteroides sp.]|nr:1,4-dihydroxy-2-naphthoate polyprenyltransferase [Bacteroides sp.]MBQ8874985.1 1,4-dihydroxy-2-naphthoate polyprenyltransferase [Bacteroides sp.]